MNDGHKVERDAMAEQVAQEPICNNCGRPIWLLEEGPDRPAMWMHKGGYGRQCPIMAEPRADAQETK